MDFDMRIEEGAMGEITATDWYLLNDIVKDIYTVELSQLPGLITSRLKEVVLCSHSMFDISVLEDGVIGILRYGSVDLPAEHINLYADEFEDVDYINWFADEIVPRVYRDTDVVSESMRRGSRMMKEWLEPCNMFYCAGMTLAWDGIPYGNFFLFRSEEEGDFSDKDMEILEVVNNHLCARYAHDYPEGLPRVSAADTSSPLARRFHLTGKEMQILTLIQEGCLRKDLPARLFISDNTLKKHLANIYSKMGIKRYEELMHLIVE